MATNPRKIADDDGIGPPPKGASPPKGTEVSRRARAALRENERLTAEEMSEVCRLTRRQARVLDAIAAGLPVKGAREVLTAIRTKLEFSIARPTSSMDHRLVSMTLVDPYSAGALVAAGVEPLLLPPAEDDSP
jgi:hypothetical protein